MTRLLNPAVRLMNQLKYPIKFILVGSLSLIAVTILTFQLISLAVENVITDRQELLGVAYVAPLSKILQAMQEYRYATSEYLLEDASFKNKVFSLQEKIDGLMKDMATIDAKMNKSLKSTQGFIKLQGKWNKIKDEVLKMNVDAAFTIETDFVKSIIEHIQYISDTSTLILDPNIKTYYLMDLIINKLPVFMERAGQILSISSRLHHQRESDEEERVKIKLLQTLFVQGSLPEFQNNIDKIILYNPKLQPLYQNTLLQLLNQTSIVNTDLENLLSGRRMAPEDAGLTVTLQNILTNSYSLYDTSVRELNKLLNSRIQERMNSIYFNLAVAIISLILLIYFFFAIYLSVRTGVDALSKGSDNLSIGNLDFKVSVDTKDELNEVATRFNLMRNTLSNFITETKTVVSAAVKGDLSQRISLTNKQGFAKQLADILNQLTMVCQSLITEIKVAITSTNVAAKEIASGNTDLAKRTESQAAALEQTAASIEELTSTVKQNTDNAKQANHLSVSASAVAVKGGDVVKQVVETMSAINASSQKVVDIISVIDGIAFQTNILALNAAVEAARAGEQGRGFAVVATEVRNLAQRSAAAAKEIKMLIIDSVDKVSEGTKLVDQAGTTMNEIVHAVQQVTEIMSAITSASLEQSAGIEQVNQAIYQMDEATQQNAALVEEAATAAQALEAQAQYMSDLVADFKIAETPSELSTETTRNSKNPLENAIKESALNYHKNAALIPHEKPNGNEWEEF